MRYAVPPDQLTFHARFGGIKWRLTTGGIEVDGEGIARTRGEPKTAQRAWTEHNEAINQWAVAYGVPVELIVATMCTESGSDAKSFRQEPGYTSDAATPHRVSYGMMHTLLSTAKAMATANAITDTITKEWLFTPANSIRVGTAYMKSQKTVTGLDPVLVGAAYNSGGVTQNAGNRWKLMQFFSPETAPHCDRFMQFFNDFWAVLNAHPVRPAFSIWQHFHQTPFVFPVRADAASRETATTGAGVTEESIKHYFEHVERKHQGGFFPLGANTVWHGGVHLRTAEAAPVAAFADGEVIAARVGEGDKGSASYGSTRFVLVRHVITGGLLNEVASDLAGKKFVGLRIKSAKGCNFRPEPKKGPNPLGLLVDPDVVDIEDPVPTQAEGLLWLKVKVKAAKTASLVGKSGWIAYLDDSMERLYEEPERIFDPEARKTYFSLYAHLGSEALVASNPHLADVTWVLKDGKPDQAVLDQLRSGDVVKLGVPVHAGDTLWTLGQYGSFGSRCAVLHWEIFSEENLLPKLEAAEDANSDFQSAREGDLLVGEAGLPRERHESRRGGGSGLLRRRPERAAAEAVRVQVHERVGRRSRRGGRESQGSVHDPRSREPAAPLRVVDGRGREGGPAPPGPARVALQPHLVRGDRRAAHREGAAAREAEVRGRPGGRTAARDRR